LRIRIQLPTIMPINADPDRQPHLRPKFFDTKI
jgi:hypothetical protein